MGDWGHLGVFGVIGGKTLKISEPRQIIYKNDALGHVIKWFSRSSTPNGGYLLSIRIKIKNFRNLGSDKLYTKFKLLLTWLQKGASRSPDPKLRLFGVKIKTFSNLDNLYTKTQKRRLVQQLPRARKKRLIKRFPRVKREAKKGDSSTNCLERSEWLRKEIGAPITSSDARGWELILVH